MNHMESHFHFLFEDSNILILINFKSLIRIFSWSDPVFLLEILVARCIPVVEVLDFDLVKRQFSRLLIDFDVHFG